MSWKASFIVLALMILFSANIFLAIVLSLFVGVMVGRGNKPNRPNGPGP